MGMWECDGCSQMFEKDDSPAALAHFNIDIDAEDNKCWGLMEVSGPAWTDFHEKSIHPMENIVFSAEVAMLNHDLLPPPATNTKEDDA